MFDGGCAAQAQRWRKEERVGLRCGAGVKKLGTNLMAPAWQHRGHWLRAADHALCPLCSVLRYARWDKQTGMRPVAEQGKYWKATHMVSRIGGRIKVWRDETPLPTRLKRGRCRHAVSRPSPRKVWACTSSIRPFCSSFLLCMRPLCCGAKRYGRPVEQAAALSRHSRIWTKGIQSCTTPAHSTPTHSVPKQAAPRLASQRIASHPVALQLPIYKFLCLSSPRLISSR